MSLDKTVSGWISLRRSSGRERENTPYNLLNCWDVSVEWDLKVTLEIIEEKLKENNTKKLLIGLSKLFLVIVISRIVLTKTFFRKSLIPSIKWLQNS